MADITTVIGRFLGAETCRGAGAYERTPTPQPSDGLGTTRRDRPR
jgi:hypothetical protein